MTDPEDIKGWNDIPTGVFCLLLLVGWFLIRIFIELIRWLLGRGLFVLQGDALTHELIVCLTQWIGSVIVLTLLFSVAKNIYNKRIKRQ